MPDLPPHLAERYPLMTAAGLSRLNLILQDPSAPAWNFTVGDRVRREDLAAVDEFRLRLGRDETGREGDTGAGSKPGASILDCVRSLRERVAHVRRALPLGFDPERDWAHVPLMTREVVAAHPEDLIPEGEALDRLIVYDTSGTTGHAMVVPFHPRTVALNHALAERAMRRWGVRHDFGADETGCINVCAQRHTYVFAAVFSVWGETGFAKVNLSEAAWRRGREDARRFFERQAPRLLTVDPVTLAEMLDWELPCRPDLIVSTALALDPALRARAGQRFRCPVVDWYSTTETGPLACTVPDGEGYELLAPDVFVEVVDGEGFPVDDGTWGRVAVTGGRNPFLPLLRYLTGDRAVMGTARDARGRPRRRIMALEGRRAVLYRALDGGVVNTVDISRILRLACHALQHQFIQRPDLSCRLAVRPVPDTGFDAAAVAAAVASLFGEEARVEVVVDERLGLDAPGGKVEPWLEGAP